MNKRILLASGAAIMLLAACQPAPNDTIAVPTTANTNAVNTVAAASATAKAAPTATQPVPTATPLPTATRAPTQTPEPAPTRAPDDAAPWAGKLKRIPGASDPDGFVYEVPPEAMAGIEDWVRRFQAFLDSANTTPEKVFSVTQEQLADVVAEPLLAKAVSTRAKAKSLLKINEKVTLVQVTGMSASGFQVRLVYLKTTRSDAIELERGSLKVLSKRFYPPAKRHATLSLSPIDGKWRVTDEVAGS